MRSQHVNCTPHAIHVWHICLHLVDFYGKCRYIYHTWILWALEKPTKTPGFPSSHQQQSLLHQSPQRHCTARNFHGGPVGWEKKTRQGAESTTEIATPPEKLTWNLKRRVSKRNLLLQGSIFKFHVSFPGCKWFSVEHVGGKNEKTLQTCGTKFQFLGSRSLHIICPLMSTKY